jgi:Mn-dependent DtxR family transcriptional regulator
MSEQLTGFERALLVELSGAGLPPAGLALALDTDLATVLGTVTALKHRGLLAREGFSTCQLTDRGRAALDRA